MISVLYVDDERELLELGKIFLEEGDQFHVDTALSASDALKIIQSQNYDAIISDYQMPGMDGIELLKRIRGSGNTIPFIIFTGRGREDVVIRALNEGVDFYLQKGGDPESQFAELAHKIKMAVKQRKSEVLLKEKTEDLNRFFDTSLDLLCIADQDGYFRRLNPEWEKTLGYSITELEGRKFLELVHPDDLAQTLDATSQLAGQKSVLNFVNRYQHKDGSYRWIEWRSIPYKNLIYAAARDITERKKIEDALIQNEKKFRTILEQATDAIILHDTTGRILDVNLKACSSLGYSKDELLQKSIVDFDPKAIQNGKASLWGEVVRGQSFTFESVNVRKNGTSFPVEVTLSPIELDEEILVLGVIRDITARKEEERILRAQQSFGQTLQTARDLPVTLDASLTAAIEISGLDSGGIYLVDEQTGDIHLARSRNLGKEFVDSVSHYPSDSPNSRLIMSGRPSYISYSKTGLIHTDTQDREGLRALAIVPILFEGKVIACLNIASHTSDEITKEARGGLETLSPQIGIAIERIRSEENLSLSEERLQLALEGAELGTWNWDIGTGDVIFNRRWADMLGYQLDEIPPQLSSWERLVHPDDMPRVQDNLSAHLEGRTPVYESEHRLRHKSGSWVWVLDRGRVIRRDPDGRPLAAAGTHLDITGRKLAEDRLQEYQQRLIEIIEFLPDATLAVDRQKRIIVWNKAIEKMTGIPAAEMMGKGDYAYTVPFYGEARPQLMDLIFEDREDIASRYPSITREGDALIIEVFCNALYHNTGAWVFAKASPLYDAAGNIVGAIESIRDITEQKRLEDALKTSERKFRSLFDNAVLGIFRSTPEGQYIDVNPAFSKIYGFDSPEEMKQVIQDIQRQLYVRPEDRQMIRERLASTGEIRNLEVENRHRDGHSIWISINARAVRGSNNEVLWLEGTVEDITSRRNAELELARRNEELHAAFEQLAAQEEELKQNYEAVAASQNLLAESEERYRFLFENLVSGFALHEIILDENGRPADYRFLAINPSFERLTGLKAGDILGKTAREVLQSLEPYWIETYGRVVLTGTPEHIENYSSDLNRWFDVLAYCPRKGQFAVIFTDITEAKHAAEELRKSEEKYRGLFENAVVGIFKTAHDGTLVIANNAFARMFGFSDAKEILASNINVGRDLYERPDDREKVIRSIQDSEVMEPMEFPVLKRDGSRFWVSVSGRSIKSPEGALLYYEGICLDITERKAAEDASQRASEFTDKLIDTANTMIVGLDVTGTITVFNRAATDITGYTLEELAGKNWFEVIVPRDRYPQVWREFNRLLEGGLPVEFENPILTKSGEERYILWRNNKIKKKGGISGTLSFGLDITERRRVEQQLEESRTLLERAMDMANMAKWEFDVKSGIFTFNDRFYALYGTTAEREGGYLMPGDVYVREFIHPDDSYLIGEEIRKVMSTNDPDYTTELEHRIIRRDGVVRTIIVRYGVTLDASGNVIATHGANQDITERKMVEENLRESEEKHRILLDDAADPIFSFYPDGTYRYVNKAFADGVGRPVDEITGRKIWDVFPKDEADKRFAALSSVFSTGISKQIEVRVPRPDGDRYYVTTITPVKDDAGAVISTICSSKDITQRRQAELALEQSEAKYRAVFAAETDAFFVIDQDSGIILDCNDVVSTMYGYQRVDLIGKPNTTISAEPEITKAVTREMQRYIPLRYHRKKDGTVFPVEIMADRVDLAGQKTLVVAVRDITERQRAEDALIMANRQLNLMTSITRHDILNKTAVILGYLALVRKRSPNPAVHDLLGKLEAAAQNIKVQIEFTRVYQDLGMHQPQWQALDVLVSRTQVPDTIRLIPDLQGSEIFASPLLQNVFDNFLDNSLRHGESVSEIRVSVQQSTNDTMTLVWEDNGIGVVPEEKEKIFEQGFGRHTGVGLFLTREILAITGITIRETGEPGKGARFEITVPKEMYRIQS